MQVNWEPHEGPQTEFCKRGEFEVLFGGAAGPGKTDCLVMVATRFVENPRYRAIILRRTFPQLQEIIDRCWTWYPAINPKAVYRATEHRWYFPSGSTVQLGHMQHEQDKYNYQGKEYHFVGFDEVTQFTESQYLYLHSRARSTSPEIPALIRATTNPGGIGHRWCKERFVDVAPPGKTYVSPDTGQTRIFIPAKVTDNPTLMDADPGYIIRLKALPEIERLRLLDGVWDIFEGQAFPELSQRIHGVQPFEIPPEWEKFMSFDWGYSKPFSVGWYAMDFDGRLWRYREWYGCKDGQADVGLKMTPIEIARGILDREHEKIKFRVADPACWSRSIQRGGVQGPPPTEDMAKEGIFFLKGDNNRIPGKMQVHQRFKLEEEIDENGEVVNENPRFYAFNDQEHFWRTLTDLRLDVKNNEDVDCFVAGTLISTSQGYVPVEKVIAGDMVETPIGPRKIKKAGLAGKDLTTTIELSNGKRLEATNDHKIYIKGIGLVPISLVSPGDQPLQEEEVWEAKKLFTEESYSENVKKESILSVIHIIAKNLERPFYTEQFGWIPSAQFLKDGRFTTLTTMGKTTLLKIYNSLMRALMQDDITKKELKTVGISKSLLLIGEQVSEEKGFFGRILQSAVKKLPSENLRALIVANLLRHDTLGKSSAQPNAKRQETDLKNCVQFAESDFSQNTIVPKKSPHAVIDVVGNSVKKAVYYLTVEQAHLFFANGVLATNTNQEDHIYDEFRYACMSRPVRPRIIPRIPAGTFAAERSRYIRAKKYAQTHGTSLELAYQRIR